MDLREELVGLELRWRQRGAPVEALLLPGLSSQDVVQALADIHDPHPDVLTWYGWHNGSHYGVFEVPVVPSGRLLTQLEEAVELQQILLDQQTEAREAGVPYTEGDDFEATWLPVATTRDADGFTIAVDLATGAVYRHDNGPGSLVYRQDNLRIADDLASLVHTWCAELDRGAYAWNGETHDWDYDPSDMPAELRELNIIR
jgi:hypothetical protein